MDISGRISAEQLNVNGVNSQHLSGSCLFSLFLKSFRCNDSFRLFLHVQVMVNDNRKLIAHMIYLNGLACV